MRVYSTTMFPVVNHLLVSHCRRLPVVGRSINYYNILIFSFFSTACPPCSTAHVNRPGSFR